jgi:hypothetical protein
MKLETTARSRPAPPGALARFASTGIYLLRGIPRDLQAAARARAVTEGTTVHGVLLAALREYAGETWTPGHEDGGHP